MVDAVGGVDIDVKKGSTTPRYDGFGLDGRGFIVTPGPHHFNGAEALAYARIRKAPGESDFTRAARQQEVLVALREQVRRGGSLLFELPTLLDAVGDTVQTDMPVERLPRPRRDRGRDGPGRPWSARSSGSRWSTRQRPATATSQVPDLTAIRAMAAALFTAPGGEPPVADARADADAEADEGPEGDARPPIRPAGGPPSGRRAATHASNRASSASQVGIDRDQRRDGPAR